MSRRLTTLFKTSSGRGWPLQNLGRMRRPWFLSEMSSGSLGLLSDCAGRRGGSAAGAVVRPRRRDVGRRLEATRRWALPGQVRSGLAGARTRKVALKAVADGMRK